jgi:hypothetical protein
MKQAQIHIFLKDNIFDLKEHENTLIVIPLNNEQNQLNQEKKYVKNRLYRLEGHGRLRVNGKDDTGKGLS